MNENWGVTVGDNERIPFDQYQRYEICNRIIQDYVKVNRRKLKVLDVGGHFKKSNGDNWLPAKDFLVDHEVLVVDTSEANLENYQISDGRDLPFEDGMFDVVVSNDVLEHIASTDRANFLNEIIRVSNGLVILNFPYYTPKKALAEKLLYEYIVCASGGENRMLEEHLVNGLPHIGDVENHLRDMSLSYSYYYSGDIDNWLKLMVVKYELERLKNPLISEYIDNYINQYHFDNEMNLEEGYRVTFLIDKTCESSIISKNFFGEINTHRRNKVDFPAETLISFLNMKKENEDKSVLDSYYFDSDSLLDRISGNTIIEQRFRCFQPNLYKIAILPATYKEKLTSSLKISVIDNLKGITIGECIIKCSWLKDNQWFEIDFVPYLESKDREFTLRIETNSGGSSPSFYYSPKNHFGELYLNGEEIDGNLSIKTFCRRMDAAERYFLINQENLKLNEIINDQLNIITKLKASISKKNEDIKRVESILFNERKEYNSERTLLSEKIIEQEQKIKELQSEIVTSLEQIKDWRAKYQQLVNLYKMI